jgi:hypothetical protein
MSGVLTMIHELDWRLSGIVACIFLTTLFFFFFPGLSIGATAFFVLALIIEFAAILFVGVPITRPLSRLRALFEWTVIGLVWIMIVLVALTILSLH